MSAPLNPVQIEEAIRACIRRIHEGVKVTSDAEREYRRLNREYDALFAQAYLEAPGPAHEKKYRAQLATRHMRERAEQAEEVFKYAERQAKALDAELRGLQSTNANIRTMYGAETGVGR